MSREETIKRPPVRGLNPRTRDLHLHISLRLGPDGVAVFQADKEKSDSASMPTPDQLFSLACRIYKARRARSRMLHEELFGEPAWDMLLALYSLPPLGERLSITALSLAAGVPQTTGLRWQNNLIQHGLVERIPDEGDGRRYYVDLTEKGRKLLEYYLTHLFHHDIPPPSYSGYSG